MDTYIYLRKSREDINKEDTLENHRNILTKLCNKKGWDYKILEEIGSSDSIESRKEIQKLIHMIETGKVKRLVVMALDRLSRNTYDSSYLQKILQENDVEIITPTKSYDLKNENDILMSDFERIIASQEYRLTRKRLLQGKQARVEQGYHVSGGSVPIGYVYNRNTREVEVHEEDAKIYRWIIDKFLTGDYTTHTLSYEFNKLYEGKRGAKQNNSSIYRILKNKFYLGYVKWKGEYYKGRHTPLITEEEYSKICSLLEGKAKVPKRKRYRNTQKLSGLVKCGCCGYTMSMHLDRKYGYFARCWYTDNQGNKCRNRSIKENALMECVNDAILEHIDELKECIENKDNSYIDEQKKKLQSQINDNNIKIEKLALKEERTLDMVQAGLYTIEKGKQEIANIRSTINDLKQEIKFIENEFKSIDKDLKSELINYQSIYESLQKETDSEKINNLLREIIKRITFTKPNKDDVSVDIAFL